MIKTSKIDDAIKVLKEKLNKDAKVQEGKIHITIKKGEMSSIVKTLVLNDIDIEYANENEHTLEDLFFDVTKEEDKDE